MDRVHRVGCGNTETGVGNWDVDSPHVTLDRHPRLVRHSPFTPPTHYPNPAIVFHREDTVGRPLSSMSCKGVSVHCTVLSGMPRSLRSSRVRPKCGSHWCRTSGDRVTTKLRCPGATESTSPVRTRRTRVPTRLVRTSWEALVDVKRKRVDSLLSLEIRDGDERTPFVDSRYCFLWWRSSPTPRGTLRMSGGCRLPVLADAVCRSLETRSSPSSFLVTNVLGPRLLPPLVRSGRFSTSCHSDCGRGP